jgi:hypothetical protein
VSLTRNGGNLHHKVTVDLTNATPVQYHPADYYHAYLRLYIPAGASSPAVNLKAVAFSGRPAAAGLVADRRLEYRRPGGQVEVAFEYDTPWHAEDRGQV